MNKALLVIIFLLFFLQFSFLPGMMNFFQPNLLLIFIITVSLIYSYHENIWWIILAGLLLDFYSSSGFGTNLIMIIVISFITDQIRNKLLSDKRNILMISFLFLTEKLIFDFGIIILRKLFIALNLIVVKNTFSPSLNNYLAQLVIFLVLGVIIYKLIEKLDRIIGKGRMDLRFAK